ncbi:hypothetical protein G4B88_000241 [Cannabis sativa]|uniref:RING-type E3 ubiquitin transferase n=1 Tax=Cannabis sativa TaxID=3483 RepID=A0A7J6GPI8_CANSA|nr:hypothetical protein G4B88_000241 [Cannabis sativa]
MCIIVLIQGISTMSDWAYSKPMIALDVLWNVTFVGNGIVVLWLSVDENPLVPLKLWIIRYALQCVFHMGCVAAEYRRRQREGCWEELEGSQGWESDGDSNSKSGSDRNMLLRR